MARSIGDALPPALLGLLDGDDLAADEGLTFLLLTTTEDGWPHLAMLSVGELVAVAPRRLRVALWRGSTAAANLARAGRATITLVHAAAGYSIRVRAEQRPDLALADGQRLAAFDLAVDEVFEDVAPYATLTGGVTYRLHDPAAVLPRWQETIRALRDRS
jgi:hypothetical protein